MVAAMPFKLAGEHEDGVLGVMEFLSPNLSSKYIIGLIREGLVVIFSSVLSKLLKVATFSRSLLSRPATIEALRAGDKIPELEMKGSKVGDGRKVLLRIPRERAISPGSQFSHLPWGSGAVCRCFRTNWRRRWSMSLSFLSLPLLLLFSFWVSLFCGPLNIVAIIDEGIVYYYYYY